MDHTEKRKGRKRKFKVGDSIREDDVNAADGRIITSTLRETADGQFVEVLEEEHIWSHIRKKKPTHDLFTASHHNTSSSSSSLPPHQNQNPTPEDRFNNTAYNDDFAELPNLTEQTDFTERTNNLPRTQNAYMEEFVARVHPMLRALLSREFTSHSTICARCSKIGRWRCKDCTLACVLCRGCMRDQHMDGGLHRIEEWNGEFFRAAELWEVGVYLLVPHHTGLRFCQTLTFQNNAIGKFQQRRDELEQEKIKGEKKGKFRAQFTNIPSDLDSIFEHATPGKFEHPTLANVHSDFEVNDNESDRVLDDLYRKQYPRTRLTDEMDVDLPDAGNDDLPLPDTGNDDLPLPDGYMPQPTANYSTEVPRFDALNNRYVRVVHTNGFHNMSLVYCSCRGREETHCDLMAAGLVPASFKRYQTVFTHSVLDDIRLTNLECKASAYQYFQRLCRLTYPMSPESAPNLYHELRRMSRIWRWMKKLKWAGVAHQPENIDVKSGELANFCPACPQPGINIPDNWIDDPNRWVYRRFFVADGNFKADHVRQKNSSNDVWLSEGGGMTAKRDVYENFVRNAIVISAKPPCKNNFRTIEMGMHRSKACDIRGITAIACARHGCFCPNSVSNLPCGETQESVDFGVVQTVKTTNVDKRQGMMLIYDIVCQYIIYFWRRIGHLLPPDMVVDAAIGLFHVHGHQDSCFFRYATSFIPGTGVVAGEILESLWSVLNAVTPAMRTATLAHRAELMDDHMTDSNHKKSIGMTEALVERFNVAISTYESANQYYDKLILDISNHDLSEWDNAISQAERTRLEDISVMDVLGSQRPTAEETSIAPVPQINGSLAEWMRIALDIEEKQIEVQDRVRRLASEPSDEEDQEIDKLRKILTAQFDMLDGHSSRPPTFENSFARIPPSCNEDEGMFDEMDMPPEITRIMDEDIEVLPKDVDRANDDSNNDADENTLHPERRMIPIPSNLRNPDDVARSTEIVQRVKQAARALGIIRDLIAEKSFQFSHVIRVAPRKGIRTRARAAITRINNRISHQCRIYTRTRAALQRLGAGQDTLNKFQCLKKEDLGSSTALINPNEPGSTRLKLSWIWQTGLNSGEVTSGALREFNRVHWLRARALRDRWKEESIIVGYEMKWTVNYYNHQAREWADRRSYADIESNLGAAAYATRKRAMYEELAAKADRRFQGVYPQYENNF